MALYSDYYQSYWGVTLTSPSKDYTSQPVLGRREMTAHYGVTAHSWCESFPYKKNIIKILWER